jgi:beta-lactamase regulating signal transducer with metallopeptidase domain
MSPLEVLAQPPWRNVTWVLIHFLWQGAVVALAVAVALRLAESARPQTRYAVCLAGMLFMVLCPVVTLGLAWNAGEIAATSPIAAANEPRAVPSMHEAPPAGESNVLAGRSAPVLHPAAAAECRDLAAYVADWPQYAGLLSKAAQPWLLAGWLAGVALLSVRLVAGYGAIRWLLAERERLPLEVADRCAVLARRLGLAACPEIFVSRRSHEALALGILRPLVLLPAAWLAEMPPSVLDAVIAHELAHIRRHDLWVNLMQRAIETLLFYHPAVWWLSRRTRREREMCCDELAVAATGQPMAYVTALERVASRRLDGVRPALAAGIGDRNMALLDRVRNILRMRAAGGPVRWWQAGLIPLIVAASLGLAVWGGGLPGLMAGEERERDNPEAAAKDGPRDADARERPEPREGDRREAPSEGDRREPPREGDRPGPGLDRPPFRGPPPGERAAPRGEEPGFRGPPRPEGRPMPPPPGELRELIRIMESLREEVARLRHEVAELRERGGPPVRRFDGPPGREGRPPERPDFDRPRPERPPMDRPLDRPAADRPGPRPEGDRPPGNRPGADRRDAPPGERPREGDGRRDGDVKRDGDARRPHPDRRDGDGAAADSQPSGSDRGST